MLIEIFCFNPFQENTFVLYDESGECVIVDPGCLSTQEEKVLSDFISANSLIPTKVLLTHSHIDHIFGLKYVVDKYKIPIVGHPHDAFFLAQAKDYALQFGITLSDNPPLIDESCLHGDIVSFGETKLQVIHVPGHSPGGVAFYSKENNCLVCGDILFHQSIGRSDLPGGNYEMLISGIKDRLLTLPPGVNVYPGHGPSTTIKFEKENNSFLI